MKTFADVFVPGVPVAQGSMKVSRGRIVHNDGDKLKGWRQAIGYAARQELTEPWGGPVDVLLSFVYKARVKADYGQYKASSPDLDKLVRAVLDALTGVLWVDDRQVVKIEAMKLYQDVPEDECGLCINAMVHR